jgi:hypothetical protein
MNHHTCLVVWGYQPEKEVDKGNPRKGISLTFLPMLASNCNVPDIHLLSSWD